MYRGPFGSAEKEHSKEQLLKTLLNPLQAGSINQNIKKL